jgi:hypothetical protein
MVEGVMRKTVLVTACLFFLPFGVFAADDVGAAPSPAARVARLAAEPVPLRDAATSQWVGIALEVAAANEATARSPEVRRNWIQRHPVLFGAAVGFAAGFLIGYLPGDDAVFDDFAAGSSGLLLGGVGAGVGAGVGWVAGRQ